MNQHIDVPTHIKGHTLDLVITPSNHVLEKLRVTHIDLSHHFLIDFNAAFELESTKEKRKITFRSKNVDFEDFRKDVSDQLHALPQTLDLEERISSYNETLVQIVNKHAPLLSKTISVVSDAA